MTENNNDQPTDQPQPPHEEASKDAKPEDTGTDDTAGIKKALEREREARARAEKEARDAKARISELESAEHRRTVAEERQLTPAQAELLSGATREELAASADKLLAAIRDESERDKPPRGRPREKLRPGAVPHSTAQDNAAIADEVLKGW